jgi:hypothetical protein
MKTSDERIANGPQWEKLHRPGQVAQLIKTWTKFGLSPLKRVLLAPLDRAGKDQWANLSKRYVQ